MKGVTVNIPSVIEIPNSFLIEEIRPVTALDTWTLDGHTCKTSIVYSGDHFTVAVAAAQVMIPDTNGKIRVVRAEGISRRSHLDKPNPDLGKRIATGRAVKALWEKLHEKNIHHKYMA